MQDPIKMQDWIDRAVPKLRHASDCSLTLGCTCGISDLIAEADKLRQHPGDDRCAVCGASHATHMADHLCRMHVKDCHCVVCGKQLLIRFRRYPKP